MDMGLMEPPPGSIADMQRQINALVTELALKERQLREVSVDDLARCLLDAQQASRDLRVALATKDDELARIKLQLKQLNSGNGDAWDRIVADASAECIRLRREVFMCVCVCVCVFCIYIRLRREVCIHTHTHTHTHIHTYTYR
jgi:hypothetical protein